jgi:hypothetical protein
MQWLHLDELRSSPFWASFVDSARCADRRELAHAAKARLKWVFAAKYATKLKQASKRNEVRDISCSFPPL